MIVMFFLCTYPMFTFVLFDCMSTISLFYMIHVFTLRAYFDCIII